MTRVSFQEYSVLVLYHCMILFIQFLLLLGCLTHIRLGLIHHQILTSLSERMMTICLHFSNSFPALSRPAVPTFDSLRKQTETSSRGLHSVLHVAALDRRLIKALRATLTCGSTFVPRRMHTVKVCRLHLYYNLILK